MEGVLVSEEMFIPGDIRSREEASVGGVEGRQGVEAFNLCTQPDEVLVATVGRGCASALELLYDRHSSEVLALTLRIVQNRQVAEELTQEVFVRVWQHSSVFHRDRGGVRGWMLGIARHLAIDEIRRRRVRPRQVYHDPEGEHAAPELGADSLDPSETVLNRMRREQVSGMLAELPLSQREVIEMAYFGGMTQAEIAKQRGEPLGTVKTRTRLGLQRLRSGLQARGIYTGVL